MDQVKIGKFIAECRKEKNMTQRQLADALEISDKTVSKWECGSYMFFYKFFNISCNIDNIFL